MIQLIQNGTYNLIETTKLTKILILNGSSKKRMYAWINAGDIGEILVTTHRPHKIDHTLVIGKYRLYDVEKEPKFTDLIHLELLVGEGMWQGYLLPAGLPNDEKKRNRIIPTNQLITKTTH